MQEESVALLFRPHGHIELFQHPEGYSWRAEWWNRQLSAKQSYRSPQVYRSVASARRSAMQWYNTRITYTRKRAVRVAKVGA